MLQFKAVHIEDLVSRSASIQSEVKQRHSQHVVVSPGSNRVRAARHPLSLKNGFIRLFELDVKSGHFFLDMIICDMLWSVCVLHGTLLCNRWEEEA